MPDGAAIVRAPFYTTWYHTRSGVSMQAAELGIGYVMLFLFDIDGTLLRGMPPLHRLALCDAAWQIFQVRILPSGLGETAGMTDTLIIQRALQWAGISTAAIESGLPRFFQAASAVYEERLILSDLRPYHTPEAQKTLEWLKKSGVYLGLVTGNIQRIAWAKLGAAGLFDYFAAGGFGDEAAEREKLPPLAIARVEEISGRRFHTDEVVVVGDTPDDVRCGAACGLTTIAVATGPKYSREELMASGADYVFDDLGGLATLQLN
jgi:phosphoglycolate phosphatase